MIRITTDARALASLLDSFNFLDKTQTIEFEIQVGKIVASGVNVGDGLKLQKSIPCVSDKPQGPVAIQPRVLFQTLKALKGDVVIKFEKFHILVSQDDKSYKVVSVPVEDPVTFTLAPKSIKISGALFRRGILRVLDFVANSADARTALTGVHIKAIEDGLRFTGTMGHMLCQFDAVSSEVAGAELNVVLPGESAKQLTRIGATEFLVYKTADKFGVQFDGGAFEASFVAEDFPAVAPILERCLENPNDIVVPVAKLRQLNRLARIYASNASHSVVLYASRDKVKLSSEDSDFGGESRQWSFEANEGLAGSVAFAFNPDYLNTILNAVDSPNVLLKIGDLTSGVVVKPTEEIDERTVMLLMPLRSDLTDKVIEEEKLAAVA